MTILTAASALLVGCGSVQTTSVQSYDMASRLGQSNSAASSLPDAPTPDLEPTIRQAAADAEANYKYGDAAAHYAALLQKHPEEQDLILGLARNLRFSGAPQQAAQMLNVHLAKSGLQPKLLIELGKDYIAADQTNLAVTALGQAQSLAPDAWDVYSALGVALDYQSNYQQAQDAYRSGLKLAPNNIDLLNNYALSLAQSGKLDAAIAILQSAVNQPSVSAQPRQNLALLLALKGDHDGAARLIRTDLPDDMATNNIRYYQGLTVQ